ncbi:MAG TPA: hypothetical protein VGC32_00335 [Solirubrobacterales bacterium]
MPARTAFEFMADGLKQDHWALGSVNRKALGGGLFIGQNSFDGSDLYVRLVSDPDLLLVDYSTGPSPDELTPRVEARIRPGNWVGIDDSHSLVTLTIWRWEDCDEETWEFHRHLWRVEVKLIKGAIERGL